MGAPARIDCHEGQATMVYNLSTLSLKQLSKLPGYTIVFFGFVAHVTLSAMVWNDDVVHPSLSYHVRRRYHIPSQLTINSEDIA